MLRPTRVQFKFLYRCTCGGHFWADHEELGKIHPKGVCTSCHKIWPLERVNGITPSFSELAVPAEEIEKVDKKEEIEKKEISQEISNLEEEAIAVLKGYGYSKYEIKNALDKTPARTTVNSLVKDVLRLL